MGRPFIAPGQEYAEAGANQREDADPRMNEGGDQDVDGDPRRIEKPEHHRARQRLAEHVEFAHDLLGDPLRPHFRTSERGVEDRAR